MKKNIIVLMAQLCLFASCAQKKSLDELFTDFSDKNTFMGTVSIFQNGKQVFNRSIGYANVKLNKKANEDTKYWIGSISKTYTATIILQLIDERKLTLTTTLHQYFPEIKNSKEITIAHLLQHRSGLYNITNDKGFEAWISEPRDRNAILERIKAHKTVFTPNTKTAYSNTNFLLLSYIAEDIEKQSFANILHRRILQKINAKRTSFAPKIDPHKNEAICYYPENGKFHPITYYTDLTGTMGAGGISATPKEINQFYTTLFTGKLLSKTALQKMTTPIDETGMGISVSNFNGLTVYGHNGAIDGFRSIAAYIPEKKVAIAIVLNATSIPTTKVLIATFKAYMHTQSLQQKGKPAQKTSSLKN